MAPMATASRREKPDLRQRLQREPYRFDFFQAVRLFERLAREQAPDVPCQTVGSDGAPEQECVRFRALASLSYPAAPVAQIRQAARTEEQPTPEMLVAFLGLTGPTGVLPSHYTALLMRRLRAKDTSLRDLLDLFNHRLVSLFYRAWEKYRLPFAYERSRLDQSPKGPEKIAQALYCLVGRGTGGLRGRQEIPEEVFLYYSGHFAHQLRSASALELLLNDYFALPIRVQQFQGQRLRLDRDDQTRLPSRKRPGGLNSRLGVDVVLGDHVWDVQGKILLRVGPLTYEQFSRFFPSDGDLLRPVSQLTRSYIGAEFVFDLQLVLKADEVPRTRLGAKQAGGSRLGWNTWMRSRPCTREVDDAVFSGVEE
jgi:type VI secretion system protein ImpH